jgi:predicted nucleic acid-binding protein
MNALIDTNIVLDVLLRREPFFDDSLMVLHASEMRIFNGFVSGSSITDIFYIINRQLRDKAYSLALLKNLVTMFLIATVDR